MLFRSTCTAGDVSIPMVNAIQPTVNAIRFGQLWTTEEMKEAQESDHDIGPIYTAFSHSRVRPPWQEISPKSLETKAYWGEWKRLEMISGLLYRRWESDDNSIMSRQLIVPFKYRQTIMQSLHDERTSAHMGRRRTIAKIKRRFYWFKMRETISRYVRTCDICQRRKRPGITPRAPLTNYIVGRPMERICIDLTGPFDPTSNDNRYIMVVCDYFSKWTDAYAIPNKESRTVAEMFVTRFVTHWGGCQLYFNRIVGENSNLSSFQICASYCRLTKLAPLHITQPLTV